MIGIVVPCCRIPEGRSTRFFRWNGRAIAAAGATVYVVSAPSWRPPAAACDIRVCAYQESPIFSIARTGNRGIRMAIDAGASVVMKTDIDVAFLDNLSQLLDVRDGAARTPQYRDVPSYKSRFGPWKAKKDCVGTVVMTATDWERLQGYDERMEGYGYDDNELAIQMGIFGITRHCDDAVAHIHHRGAWNRHAYNPRRKNNALPLRRAGSQPQWGRP